MEGYLSYQYSYTQCTFVILPVPQRPLLSFNLEIQISISYILYILISDLMYCHPQLLTKYSLVQRWRHNEGMMYLRSQILLCGYFKITNYFVFSSVL